MKNRPAIVEMQIALVLTVPVAIVVLEKAVLADVIAANNGCMLLVIGCWE